MCAHSSFPSVVRQSALRTRSTTVDQLLKRQCSVSTHTRAAFLSIVRLFRTACASFLLPTFCLRLCWLCVRVARMHLGFVVLCVKCRRSLHYYAFIMKIEVVCFIYIVGILCFVDVSCRTHIERIILFSIAPDLSIVRWTERKRERNGYNSNNATMKM